MGERWQMPSAPSSILFSCSQLFAGEWCRRNVRIKPRLWVFSSGQNVLAHNTQLANEHMDIVIESVQPGFYERGCDVWAPVERRAAAWAWIWMMCIRLDACTLATVPSDNCNPDLNPPSSWPQSLALPLSPKCLWEREGSSGGKAQDGFRWWFLARYVTCTAGIHALSKSGLCPAWRANLGV